MRPRVISTPFTPPAMAPRTSVNAAAPAIGSPPSRQSLPKTTADRPMSEPTDRSMPPLVITGVKATASRPISTLSRSTSKALATDRKLVPITEKTSDLDRQQPDENPLRRLQLEPGPRGFGDLDRCGRYRHVLPLHGGAN